MIFFGFVYDLAAGAYGLCVHVRHNCVIHLLHKGHVWELLR